MGWLEIDGFTFTWILISLLFIVIVAIILIIGFTTVPQGMKYTVERFGKYTKILEPGWRFLPPFDKISNKVDIREQVMDVPRQEVITKDNAMVTVDGVIFYKIIDAAKATYQVTDLNDAIMQLTITNIRSVMGSMDLDDILSKRDEINEKLLKVVDKATDPWGVTNTGIEIKDITPPQDLVESMGRQMKAERDKRAVILEAEGQRRAVIEKAEGEKRANILKAEGEKEAAILNAQAHKETEILRAEARQQADILDSETLKESANYQAYAREKMAEAEAKATEMVSQAIMNGDIQAINYFIAQKYVEALQNIASAENQKLIMMPLEASNMIGSISGISEIAKEIFANKQ